MTSETLYMLALTACAPLLTYASWRVILNAWEADQQAAGRVVSWGRPIFTGLCVDCGYHRVLHQGKCSTCGSESVMSTRMAIR